MWRGYDPELDVEAAMAEGFTFVDWLTAVDRTYLDEPGFDIVARLLDVSTPGAARGLRLTTRIGTGERLESLTPLAPGFAWHERETFDFFGIIFDGHPALTRIQMPDDWPGHPQRKDYPLGGIPVEYKGTTIPPPDTRRSYN